MKSSIRAKLIVLSLSGVLFTSAVQGSAGLRDFKNLTEQGAARTMNLVCAEKAQMLDGLFMRVEQSARLLEGHALHVIDRIEYLKMSEEGRSRYIRLLREDCYNVATNTNGALSAFVRFSPEFRPADIGVYCHYDSMRGAFGFFPLTDLTKYRPEQAEHVGWWYEPAAAGRPLWMKPYFNANTGCTIFTYVIPLFKEGKFCGVVGMDVDFAMLRETVVSMEDEKGRAFLTDGHGGIVYHPEVATGTRWPSEFRVDPAFDTTAPDTGEKGIIPILWKGKEKLMAYRSLRNGMRLVYSSEEDVLFRDIRELMNKIFWQVCALTAIFAAIALWIAHRLASPLRELSATMARMADGDLDVPIKRYGSDEIGRMADSFNIMAGRLREHVSAISGLAYRDSLTGVKNKTAFVEMQARLQKDMDEGTACFALMVLDVNGLKQVNDRYGHTAGDTLIQQACRVICQTFKRSPVFRVGGDEFIVVLENDDLNDLPHLMGVLQCCIDESNTGLEPGLHVSIASGVAYYVSGGNFDSLLKEADENMYRCKAAMKEAALQKQG